MSTAPQWQDTGSQAWGATGTDGAANLQQVAADRLAAHRGRRAAAAALASSHQAETEARARQHREAMHSARSNAQRHGASLVRDAVVARYEGRESYREFLAAEAERAIAQAQAEAEVATRNAQAVAEVQMALLEELDQFRETDRTPRQQALAHRQAETRGELAHALADIALGARELIAEPVPLTVVETSLGEAGPAAGHEAVLDFVSGSALREISSAGLTVRLFEDMPSTPRLAGTRPHRGRQFSRASQDSFPYGWEEDATETLCALDEEIEFRRAPAFAGATALDAEAIPGNLIEFPRELVAPRRARPRLAEGPIGDGPVVPGGHDGPQLRIFEVEAEQTHMAAVASAEPHHLAPEWQSLQLSGFNVEAAEPTSGSDAQTHLSLPLFTAPLERRLMSATVDLCAVGFAWIAALTCVAEVAGPALRALSLPLAAASGLAAFAVLGLLYEFLFFTVADATPGMRFARIALCTFGDGNPTRRAMRRRVVSAVFAACPLGLGLAWALLDNDKLGWHDRMSRMYQRAY